MSEKLSPRNKGENMPRAEADVYKKLFESEARNINRKEYARRLFPTSVTPVDVARTHAERDNADFERRKHKEFKEWEKNLKVVVEHLKTLRDGKSEGRECRPLLLILGGAMKGAYAAAQAKALHDIGMGKLFDTVVGVSAGAGTSAYFVAGPEQAAFNASMYPEECATKEFLDLTRIPKVLDTGVIARAVRSGPKALDVEAIQNSKTELYVAATAVERDDPETHLINMKAAAPDMATALEAATAIPFFRSPVQVNEEKYIDGAFNQVPIMEVIERFKPTDILVLPNMAFDEISSFNYSMKERLAMWGSAKMGSLGSLSSMNQVEEFFRMKEHIRNFFENIKKEMGVNIGVLWPRDAGLGNLTNDSHLVRAAMYDAARGVYDAFEEEQPHEISLYK